MTMTSELETSATWSDVSARAGRADMPYLLAKAVLIDSVMTEPDEIAKGLQSAWTMPEWPGRALDEDVWLMLWNYALGVSDDCYLHETEVRSRDELPETMTLWRGAAEGYEHGMSWTTDESRARWFATRFGGHIGGKHSLLRAEVPRDVILAKFNESRGEDEWVVDPGLIDLYAKTVEENL